MTVLLCILFFKLFYGSYIFGDDFNEIYKHQSFNLKDFLAKILQILGVISMGYQIILDYSGLLSCLIHNF